jgi:hypothetical protein
MSLLRNRFTQQLVLRFFGGQSVSVDPFKARCPKLFRWSPAAHRNHGITQRRRDAEDGGTPLSFETFTKGFLGSSASLRFLCASASKFRISEVSVVLKFP